MPLLLHSRSPKPVQISGLGTWTRLSYVQTSQNADSERIFILAYYYEVGTSGNALECHIISAGLWLRLFTVQSVYFHIWNCSWNYKPSGVCERGFSRTVKLWENRDLTVLPVITYIYLFGRIYAFCLSANLCILFILFFKPPLLELSRNWTETIYQFHFIMYKQLVLSPF